MAKYFAQALSGFMQDFANGGAIRHLADLGYNVAEIISRLDYPVSKEMVAKIVWRHYLDTGVVFLDEPPEFGDTERVTYVKEQGKYGRITMRRVVERVPLPETGYVACDFGRRLYRERELFLKQLQLLTESDREYVLDLPWPLQTVYHVENERMKRMRENGFISG